MENVITRLVILLSWTKWKIFNNWSEIKKPLSLHVI